MGVQLPLLTIISCLFVSSISASFSSRLSEIYVSVMKFPEPQAGSIKPLSLIQIKSPLPVHKYGKGQKQGLPADVWSVRSPFSLCDFLLARWPAHWWIWPKWNN